MFVAKDRLHGFDTVSFFITFLLLSLSLLNIFSATYQPDQPFSVFFNKQLFGIVTGLIIYLIMYRLDHRVALRYGYFGYFLMIGLLIFTLLKGSIGMGAGRWIDLKIIKFQPSELAKVFLAPFFTYYLETEERRDIGFIGFLPIMLLLGVSFLLVCKQPDLGTALIIAFTGALMLWFAGIGKRFFLICFFIGLVGAPIFYRLLHPYQRKRIEVFLGAGDVRKERYQLEQSKIAIGSGGFIGKGFLQGTQTRLHFLPESRTDFIFSVCCEEWGLLGAFFILLLYALLIGRALYRIYTLDHYYDQLLAIGLLAPIGIAVIINTGMVTGLLPIVGIPLPLMSYGITHTWATVAALGWLNAITARSKST